MMHEGTSPEISGPVANAVGASPLARTFIGCLLGSLALAACSTVPGEPAAGDTATDQIEQASIESTTASNSSLRPVADASATGSGEFGAAHPQDDAPQGSAPQEDPNLQQQVNKVLGRRAYEAAQVLFQRGSLQEAFNEIQRALRYDSGAEEYLALDRRIRNALGKLGPTREEQTEDASKASEIKMEQIRAQASIWLQRAKKAMEVGDYTGARRHADKVLSAIQYAPIGRWDDIEADAKALRARATELHSVQVQADEERLREEVEDAMKNWKDEIERRRDSEIASLIRASSQAFQQERYKDAMDYAQSVLRVDPENEKAQQLTLSSKKLMLDKSRSDYLKAKRERFAAWRQDNESLKVPYTEVLIMPDARKFTANDEARRKAYADESPEAEAAIEELRKQLKSAMVPGGPPPEGEEPKLQIASLQELIELVRNNPPIIDGSPVRVMSQFASSGGDFGDEGPEITLEFYNDISLLDVMELAMQMANVGAEEGGTIYDFQLHPDRIQFVKIGGEEEGTVSDAELRVYQVRDLTFRLNNFKGPDIGTIRLPGGYGDDMGSGPYGGIDEDTSLPLITGDKLIELIQSTIAPNTWNEPYSIERGGDEESPTVLLVSHRPDVQRQVDAFLGNLKRTTTSLVTIESKFLTISENFLQEVGIDFRGLGGVDGTLANLDDLTNGLEDMASLGLDNLGEGSPSSDGQHPSSGIFFDDGSDGDLRARTENIFDNELGKTLNSNGGATVALTFLDDTEISMIFRAVEKFADFRIVNSQTLSVFNTQRAYITVINQISYIQDFDVEVAQASFIADPVVNILQEGVVLDVRPVITQDRKHIILELRPTVANLKRPIPLFQTSLAGLTIPVSIQIPELQVASAQTTAVVPDGASILIGGLKTIRNVERRAEVPVIADLPLIGFLGRREGISDETDSLMVLIRAYITDVQDELERYLDNN